MPCNCDHMESSALECEASRLVVLLDEMAGLGSPNPKTYGDGYDKRVYGRATRKMADEMTAKLCGLLSAEGVAGRSLEMQVWWRDHQTADEKKNQSSSQQG